MGRDGSHWFLLVLGFLVGNEVAEQGRLELMNLGSISFGVEGLFVIMEAAMELWLSFVLVVCFSDIGSTDICFSFSIDGKAFKLQ